MMKNSVLLHNPVVFAVGDTYQIIMPVKVSSIIWIKIGGFEYFDESNGVLRSNVGVHKIIVPMDLLNKEKRYTVCYREIIERTAYFTKTMEEGMQDFEFHPVKSTIVIAYHIADAHGKTDAPVNAAKEFIKKYGKIDFLILNGDIIDSAQCIDDFYAVYEIASRITEGKIPVICSRGNHANRGVYAENLREYFPCRDGNTFYSVKIGNIWALVLDCGEDKEDSHPEYGNTMCSHIFRQKETEYIENIVRNANDEYLAEDVNYKIVIVHTPFTRKVKPPFDIERDIYSHWADILKNEIKAELMISGHEHRFEVEYPGGERDALGHPCPIVIGSWIKHPNDEKNYGYAFVGAGLAFEAGKIKVVFNDDNGTFFEEYDIKRNSKG